MAESLNKVANVYFDRFSHREEHLKHSVASDLGLIVVIPCYNEPNLIRSLQALQNAVIPKDILVEVIIVINHGLNAPEGIVEQNQITLNDAIRFAERNIVSNLLFHTIEVFDMPKKTAGVGLARKIGMDEALYRFSKIDKDGIIVCFDADSLCETNYFEEIVNHFNNHPKSPGCSIHFEHPIEGSEFSRNEYDAIISYELHLRYYKNALQFAGLPYAYHTIGSSMAVRASAYAKQGGMNKRKAGEDFYFLNKIIQLGNFSELNKTKVIPSPRISDRVPFGTGKAVGDIIENEQTDFLTYNFKIFSDLKEFCEAVFKHNKQINFLDFPDSIKRFIEKEDFENKVTEISKNTTSEAGFIIRFFRVFDAFWVLKYVHFVRDNFYEQSPILNASTDLLLEMGAIKNQFTSERDVLEVYRELDKLKR